MTAVWVWVLFAAGVLAVLLVDLVAFHRGAREVSVREAGAWTLVWLVLAVAFAGILWAWRGGGDATQYLTGYVVERSLSIDNVFVLAVIFAYFGVPTVFRHRALLWGVVGALVLRAGFIAAGAAALERFSWTVYVLGGLLVVTGMRLAVRDVEAHPHRNVVVRAMRRVVPMTDEFDGQRFLVRRNRRLMATPMLAVLVAIASTDVAFAVDSVPAIFAVTNDPFLVFAANAFSVLGMLALYFLLAGMLDRFRYLRPGLAAILVFVGVKMGIAHSYEIPTGISLAVILTTLAVAVAASLLGERRDRARAAVSARGRGPGVPTFVSEPTRR